MKSLLFPFIFLLFIYMDMRSVNAQDSRFFINEDDSFYLQYPVNYSCGAVPDVPIIKAILCDCNKYDEDTSPPCITVSTYDMTDTTDFSKFIAGKVSYLKNGEYKKSVKVNNTGIDTLASVEFAPVYGKEKLKSKFVWIKRNNMVIEFFLNDNSKNYEEHLKDFEFIIKSFQSIHFSCKDGSIAKEGVFKKTVDSNDSIVKKDGINTEYLGNGQYVKSKMVWVNDCEFRNEFIDSNLPKEILEFIKEDMIVKIIEEDENSYTCIWWLGELRGVDRYFKIR